MIETSGSSRQLQSTRRLRVAFCIDSFAIGGTELNAVRTAEAFDYSRIELSVYHLQTHGPLRERYEKLGVRMTHIPIPNLYSWRAMAQGVALARMLRQERIDIVHSHDIYTNIFSAPWVRLLTPCKLIASRRWWYEAPRPELSYINRLSYRMAHRVLANSSGVADLLVQDEHVDKRKVVVVPNFLEKKAFETADQTSAADQRKAWGIPNNTFLVGIVARLSPVKNHKLLLRAMQLLDSRFHLVVIGDGPERTKLEAMTRKLCIDERVHFIGEIISKHNLHQYFDVSVLCSSSEGFPNTVIEAMAARRPVIATPVGGITDAIENGHTGILVQVDDPAPLASAIKQLESDPELCKRLGQASRDAAHAKYNQDAIIAQLHALYDDLAGIEPVDKNEY